MFINNNKISRLLVKISGEILGGNGESRFDIDEMHFVAEQIIELHNSGLEVSLVVGGGNILRGSSFIKTGIDRAPADYMGMLSTVINALAMQNMFEKMGVSCRVLSSIAMTAVCEPYICRRAIRHLEKRRIVIFAAGTGNPFFTTDTAAVLRAIETNCSLLVKSTKVDGAYSSDPCTDKNAVKFSRISHQDVLIKGLKVMDSSAIALAKENNLSIAICNYRSNLISVLSDIGSDTSNSTLITTKL
jgi:uridylate kinase